MAGIDGEFGGVMPETIGEIFVSIIGVGGGAAFISYALMKTLGAKWLDAQFSERLERFRYEKAKELQHLKSDIDGALKATIRLQEREFEVLAESWHLMNTSYGAAEFLVNPMQSYQNVGDMSDKLRKEYLDGFAFLPEIKQEIIASSNPTEEFYKNRFWLNYNNACSANADFNNYVYKNEIFMETRFAEGFKLVSTKISNALLSRSSNHSHGSGRKDDDSWETISKDCAPLVHKMGKELRGKFFNQGVKLQDSLPKT